MSAWRAALALGMLALPGCLPVPTMGTGTFHDTRALPTLQRGVSTSAEVERRLGAPNGEGAARFQGDAAGRKLWYYEDLRASGTELRPDGVRTTMRQQILLVFFKGDVFDGYLWTDATQAASAR